MSESFLARITPVSGPDGPVDPGYGQGTPNPPHVGGGPIVIPPLPGIWPPKGEVVPPIHYPPVGVMPPIFIDGTPELPINLPPGLWPPLPPEIGGGPVVPPPTVGGGPVVPPGAPGVPANKAAILVMVVGLAKGDIWSGYRWYVFEKPPDTVGGGPIGVPQPKFGK